MAKAKYPIGIETFSKIREEGYLYVDKTEFVQGLWQMKRWLQMADSSFSVVHADSAKVCCSAPSKLITRVAAIYSKVWP